MSRIPKMPNSAVKENRPGILNRQLSRTVVNGLSEADKKSLIMNHTRPLRNGPTSTSSLRNGPSSSVAVTGTFRSGPTSLTGSLRNGSSSSMSVAAGPRLKRSATIPPAAVNLPKNAKIDKKPTTVAKIAPYDFKAKFHDLLEKHKVVKSELIDLKDKHVEVADENEKIKETIQSSNHERDMLREKLFSVKSELSEKTSEYIRLKLEYEIQKRENEDLHNKTKILAEITESLKKKSLELETLQIEHNEITRRYNALKEETEALRVLTDHLKKISVEHDNLQLDHKKALQSVANYKSDAESLQNILAGMYKEQRELRNTIQDLKGNIRVYCRVRPPLESELARPQFNLNLVDACTIEVQKIELNSAAHSTRKGKPQHNFTFDGIFSRHSRQEDVFAEVSPMIQSALDGYNVCIFAYGQTGSGKTYTMEGGCGTEEYGIIPRALNMIFTCMEDLKKMGWELNIKASFLEIYNEIIYDLLDSSKDQENHEIKMVNSKGTDVYVSNLKEEEVMSSHDFIRLMMFAQRNRQTAATLNNERSSRSHSVTQIKISAINEKRKEKFMSNLNLVDLAGSESGKTTQRMDETKHINRSLSELSKVILSLQTNQNHIPYRNSKLTHLLMPSLGGNSKTLMLVNINQFDDCFGETLNSLRFATKVNNCRIVKAKKNITMVDSV